ncbi:MAG: hypothetical protein JSW14_07540 [Candidatus Bathyarchaeum sp.]|nr:MAG: hypothetical protein JSW14_07540 [Candidatus Bathyarchaeum sp.]
MCKIVDGETKTGAKVDAVQSFSKTEIKELEIAFDHRKTVDDAFAIIT